MINRQKIIELLFDKIIIASLLTFSGGLVVGIFNTAQERAEFAAKYAASNAELRSESFAEFSSSLEKIFFLVGKSVGIEDKVNFLRSDEVSNEISVAHIKLDRMILISQDNGGFSSALRECKSVFVDDLSYASIADTPAAQLKTKISKCYTETAINLSEWLSEGALASYDAAIQSARKRYPLRETMTSDGALISFFALFLTSLVVIYAWRKSGPETRDNNRFGGARRAAASRLVTAKRKKRFAFVPTAR